MRMLLTVFCLCIALILCFALRPLLSRQPDGPYPNAKPETAFPFDATGLTARGDESAEEILARAHERDTGAAALATAGYFYGLGGFPRDEILAGSWLAMLDGQGLVQASAFLNVMLTSRVENTPLLSAAWAADCETGRQSPLAAAFKQAGVFDMEARCAQVRGPAGAGTDWSGARGDFMRQWEEWKEYAAAARNMMRKASAGPLSKDEQKDLDALELPEDLDAYLFFAATRHDLESEIPDWDAERLLWLIGMQARQSAGSGVPSVPARWAAQTLLERLTFEPGQALETIRSAHQGDTGAMRTMALHYLHGSLGFARSGEISRSWLERAGRHGDVLSLLLLAADDLSRNHNIDAWAKASLAGAYGKGRIKESAATLVGLAAADMDAAHEAEGLALVREFCARAKVPPETAGICGRPTD